MTWSKALTDILLALPPVIAAVASLLVALQAARPSAKATREVAAEALGGARTPPNPA